MRLRESFDVNDVKYTPHRMLNVLQEALGVRSDYALAHKLSVGEDVISRIRNRKIRLTPFMMVRILDITGWSIEYLREVAGLPPVWDRY